MDELRKQIAQIVLDADGSDDAAPVAGERAKRAADAILALPEMDRLFSWKEQIDRRLARGEKIGEDF